MTYIEPTPPGTPQPDIDPGSTPAEVPPLEPGGGDQGDSRPYGNRDD